MTTACKPPPRRHHVPVHGQRGMGMAGFLATAIPVIWLGLGGVELAHWMQVRQALSLILMDAARAGATRQAEPGAMARAFEQGLRQLHPAPGETGRILARRRRDLGSPWHMAIQLPSRQAFADHADTALQGRTGGIPHQLIRNDHQTAQHAARQTQGWPEGRGPRSGLTIHQANTLRIALQWPHQPLFPGAAVLVKTLAPLARDPRNRQWMAAGYLPFRRTVTVAMQSHPAEWPDLPDGRITREAELPEPQRPFPGNPPLSGKPIDPPPPGSGGGSISGGNGGATASGSGGTEPGPEALPEQRGSGSNDGRTESATSPGGEAPAHEELCGP